MSHSKNSEVDQSDAGVLPLLKLSRMMKEGRSWSGHERNCCFLNTADGRFATISAASGIDFPDDGRAVAISDWDADGDLDLFISNRNAPRVRYLRNDMPSGRHFVAFKLTGDGKTSSRDAIGARIEVDLKNGGGKLVKALRAGEGFLAQSSKWLHFGLGASTAIEKVTVRWPGGQVTQLSGMPADRRYEIWEGESQPREWNRPASASPLAAGAVELPASSESATIPLLTLLPVPRLAYQGFDGTPRPLAAPPGKALLINLWASWCKPCLAELKEFSANENELRGQGLEIVALAVDGLGDDRSSPQAAAELLRGLKFPFPGGQATAELLEILQQLHNSLIPLHRPLPVPTSFLIDGRGRMAAIFKGKTTAREILGLLAHSSGNYFERWKRAAALPGTAIELEPIRRTAVRAETKIRFQLANALWEKRRLEDARLHFQELLEIRPDFADARNNLGLVYFHLGKTAEAYAEYQQALKLKPDSAAVHFNLGIWCANEKIGDANRAAGFYERALSLEPDYPEVHNALGLLLAKQGRLADAAAHFQKEIDLHPGFAGAYDHLGLVKLQSGQTLEAKALFEQALARQANFPDAHMNLGIACRRLGDLQQAILHYQQAVSQQPDFAEAHNNLGLAYVQQGQMAQARIHFEKAISIQPNFNAARDNLQRLMKN